eukprot:gene1237-1361_t
MLMYADDTVLLYSSPSSKGVTETLSRDGDLLFTWFQKNDLIVNLKPGKTETVLYGTAQKLRTQPSTDVSINGDTINRVNQYEYLGVTFDRHMNFSEQLSKISKKTVALWLLVGPNIRNTTPCLPPKRSKLDKCDL